MDKKVSNQILQAIKTDNLMLFLSHIKGHENLCFGRFPILSVAYLYGAKKIIKKYRNKLLMYKAYEKIDEPLEIYQKFSAVAGRCLRLYVADDATVSPIEMLAILHMDAEVKKIFRHFSYSKLICKNLQTIYGNINLQKVEMSGSKIKIGMRRFDYHQKKSHKLIALCSAVAIVFFAVAYFAIGFAGGFGTNLSYAKVGNQNQLIYALKNGGNFRLTNDISFDQEVCFAGFSGVLDGNNKTIYISKFADWFVLNNNGTIKNLNVVVGSIDKQTDKSFSLLVGTNNGTLQNVRVSCDSLKLTCNKSKDANIYVNGFANHNNGYIKDCTLNLNANVVGNLDGECFVAGFAGTNSGTISGCEFKANSSLLTAEADVCGIATDNNLGANVSSCKNFAAISQSSKIDDWSPNASGIVQTNYGAVTNCHNFGDILVESTNSKQNTSALVFVGGISTTNYGTIEHCLNKGKLSARSNTLAIYCGGISAYSSYWVQNNQMIMPILKNCASNSKICVSSAHKDAFAFVGGISGFLWGEMFGCYSLCSFETAYDQTKNFVGNCLGSSYLQYQFFGSVICISASNNFMLDSEATEFQIGALINNGQVVANGQNSPSGEVVTLATEQLVKQQEIFWDEQN